MRSSPAAGTVDGDRGGERAKGTAVWREARDDRDANSFCSLPRLLRPFLRMQIVGGRGVVECVPRACARGRKNKGAEDYEYISFTISREDRCQTQRNTIMYPRAILYSKSAGISGRFLHDSNVDKTDSAGTGFVSSMKRRHSQ